MTHSDRRSFIDQCLSGDVDASTIDDFIDAWRKAETSKGRGRDHVVTPVYEFLGMTRDEYALWVEQPTALRFILRARRNRHHDGAESVTPREEWK